MPRFLMYWSRLTRCWNVRWTELTVLLLCASLVLSTCVRTPTLEDVDSLYPARTGGSWQGYDSIVPAVPKLKNSRGERWPLVLWQGADYQSMSKRKIRRMLKRGIVQHVRLRESDIPSARAIQGARAPVVIMEGRAGSWPYDVPKHDWRLKFEPSDSAPANWKDVADPTKPSGWLVEEQRINQVLERFKMSGVNVDALWLDYEGAVAADDYEPLRHSTSAPLLAEEVLADRPSYLRYRRQEWLARTSRYLATPALQVFPEISVTNWVAMFSSVNRPLKSWDDWTHPPTPPLFFTHSNPVAYGIDTYFYKAWPEGLEINRKNVDRFYTHLMLRQVSVDAFNRHAYFTGKKAVAWVARWVKDEPERDAPVMSREAYREVLRHIWLRGVEAMQVFNAKPEGYEDYSLIEVLDAQRIYDEMLEYKDFLDRGEVMSYAVPDNRVPGVLWSGLRLDGEALVRVSSVGGKTPIQVCPWTGRCFELEVSETGRTVVLRR